MALINCQECGKEISSKAYSCPSCGYPTIESLDYKNHNLMKNQLHELIIIRSILRLFEVLILFGLFAVIFFISR